MPFPTPGSHNISLNEAADMTRRFRESVPSGSIIGGLFNAADIRRILDQPDCAGLRYYYGLNDSGDPVILLVGVTVDNEDLYSGELAEISTTCPNFCPTENPLNGQ